MWRYTEEEVPIVRCTHKTGDVKRDLLLDVDVYALKPSFTLWIIQGCHDHISVS